MDIAHATFTIPRLRSQVWVSYLGLVRIRPLISSVGTQGSLDFVGVAAAGK